MWPSNLWNTLIVWLSGHLPLGRFQVTFVKMSFHLDIPKKIVSFTTKAELHTLYAFYLGSCGFSREFSLFLKYLPSHPESEYMEILMTCSLTEQIIYLERILLAREMDTKIQ